MTDTPATSFLVRHRLVALVLLGILLYVPFLGLRDMWYPDEPDIGEVVQAMYVSGDWVAPRRNGVIWVDYPPMLYWAGSISSHLFGGLTEFTLRLPNALAAIALVALTCVVGSRWFGPRAGLWAGFLLLTFQQYAYQAVCYRPDVLFSLAIGAGIFIYAHGAGDRPRVEWRAAGFVCLGLAMLAKGPLGLLLPGLVLTLWHGARREWRRLLELAPLSLLAVAVYLPWFVACAKAMGSDNILYELYAQNFARFVGGARGHGYPIYYYLKYIWIDLAPWSPLLPFAVHWLVRSGRWRDRNVQLALWWLGVFFVFLSVAVTKRQLYMLPAYPAAALLLGPWFAAVACPGGAVPDRPSPRPARVFGLAVAILLAVLGAAAITAVVAFEPVLARADLNALETETAYAVRAPLAGVGLLLVGAALWIAHACKRNTAGAVLVRTGVVHVALYLVLLAWLLPAMDPVRTYRPQSEWVRDQIGAETHFGLVNPQGNMGFRKMGGFGFYSGRLVAVLERQDEVVAFFQDHPSSLVLVEEHSAADIFAGDEAAWRSRVVRDLYTGRTRYLVVRGP